MRDVPHGWPGGLLETGGRAGVHHSSREHPGLHGLPPEAPRSPPEGPLLEHVLLGGVNGPVVTLPGPPQGLRQLDEALIEGQVVSD